MSRVTGKRVIRSFSLSYPKKDWQAGPHQSFSLGMTPTIQGSKLRRKGIQPSQIIFCSRCHTKSQSFFWYDNGKGLEAHFPMTWHNMTYCTLCCILHHFTEPSAELPVTNMRVDHKFRLRLHQEMGSIFSCFI